MLNHHRTNDYRTPRTLNDAFGPYAEWKAAKQESRWWYVAAAGVMVAIVWMLCR